MVTGELLNGANVGVGILRPSTDIAGDTNSPNTNYTGNTNSPNTNYTGNTNSPNYTS